MPHSKDAASAILAPHMEALGGLFSAAWRQWEEFGEKVPDLRMQCCARTRASMVHDFAVSAARVAFGDKAPAVTLHDTHRVLLLDFDSQLSLRLNKFQDGTHLMGGIHTHQRQAFAAQEPLTGMPESTNLVLGYTVNADGTDIVATAITCSTRTRTNWVLEIGEPGETILFASPPLGPDPVGPSLTSALQPREEAERSNSE